MLAHFIVPGGAKAALGDGGGSGVGEARHGETNQSAEWLSLRVLNYGYFVRIEFGMPAGGREMLLGRGRGYPLAHTCATRYKLGPHTLRNYSQTRIPFEFLGGDKQRRQSARQQQQQHYSMSGLGEGERG